MQPEYHETSVLDVMAVVRFFLRIFVFFCCLAYIAFAMFDTGCLDDQIYVGIVPASDGHGDEKQVLEWPLATIEARIVGVIRKGTVLEICLRRGGQGLRDGPSRCEGGQTRRTGRGA